MNPKQKLALKLGVAAAVFVCVLFPWTDVPFTIPIPTNYEPLISWGIMSAQIGSSTNSIALLLVVIVTGISLIILRSRKTTDEPREGSPPIPRP